MKIYEIMKIYENYKIFWKLWNLIKIMKFYENLSSLCKIWKFMKIYGNLYTKKYFMTSYEHFINAIERKEKIERKMLPCWNCKLDRIHTSYVGWNKLTLMWLFCLLSNAFETTLPQ